MFKILTICKEFPAAIEAMREPLAEIRASLQCNGVVLDRLKTGKLKNLGEMNGFSGVKGRYTEG